MQVDLKFDVRPRDAFGRYLKSLDQSVQEALVNKANSRASEITDWMKSNAPWQDRTGAARESLTAFVDFVQNRYIEFIFTYDDPNVTYDQYLETMQSGRFSILGPAMDHWGQIIWNDVREFF